MKLGARFLLMLAIVFVGNMLFVILFFTQYISREASGAFQAAQSAFSAEFDENAARISAAGSSMDNIAAALDSDTLALALFDPNGALLASSDHYMESGALFTREALVETGRGRMLIKGASRSEAIEVVGPYMRLFFVCEVVVLLLMCAIAVLLFYEMVAEPLKKLNGTVERFRQGKELPDVPKIERKDEIGQLERSFYALASYVISERNDRKRIIGSISHDIKSPLTSIIGYSERILRDPGDTDKVLHGTEIIRTKADRINDLVQDFDSFVNSGDDVKLSKERITLSQFMQDLESEMQTELESKGVSLHMGDNTPKGTAVLVDPEKFARIFLNAFRNSVHHGGTQMKNISVRTRVRGDFVEFFVEDDGSGMNQQLLHQAFTPFFTSDPSRNNKNVGLGLSISRTIVQLHGGTITAYNLPTGGFCLEFSIPLAV